jgi:hypothetical protein
MDERERLSERFQQHRSHLRAVAYRMLGSAADADDALQEAWLRIHDQDAGRIENMQAWLTTVVGRVCLNMLRARRARREKLSGVRLPDPVVTLSDAINPEREALLADSLGLAMLVVLEALLRIDGGRLRRSASVLLHGAEAVAAHTTTYSKLHPYVVPALVNGMAGAVIAPHGEPYAVMAFTVTNGKVTAIDALLDPERLRQLDLPAARNRA